MIGQNSTAVGRTEKVWGSLTIDNGSVTKGTFTANMASVTSDQSERNAQFDGRIMNVSTYPTAEFVITKTNFAGCQFIYGDGQDLSDGWPAYHARGNEANNLQHFHGVKQ